MHHDIVSYYRKDNPLFNVKTISKDDLVLAAYPNIKKSALLYLMSKHNLSYDTAETYLKYIPFVKNKSTNKINELFKLKQELFDAHYLHENDPLRRLYSNKKIMVIGYSKDDKQLLELASLLNLELSFFSFENNNKPFEANQFVRFEDEINYAFNEIAHLLDAGININDIVIVRRNKEYDYYLQRFAPLFGFQINLNNSCSWYETGVYVEFMKLYEESKDINTALDRLFDICQKDELYEEFTKVIKHLVVDGVDFEIQKSFLVHQLKTISTSSTRYYPAVEVSSNISFYENKYVFVLGFTQGDFPQTSKDDSYLSNQELDELKLLNAKQETKFDQEIILNLLREPNRFVFSYSLKSLQQKRFYASPILKELELEPINNPFNDYFYSKKGLTYIFADLKDSEKYYLERRERFYQLENVVSIPYDEYHNEYTETFVYNQNSYLTLSCSQLDLYYSCPFKYFLSRVLNVDPFEENDAIILGNILHSILEDGLLNESYDVKTKFIDLVEASNVSQETKILWRLSLVEQVTEMVDSLRKHRFYMTNPQFKFEIELNSKLDDKTTVTGRIDKLIVLNNQYVIAVDYKTGSSGDFKPDYLQYGKSNQLPTYAYLINNNEEYSEYQVAGLYINHIIKSDNDMSIKEDDVIQSHLKLSGKSIPSLDFISSFDNTIASGKSSFIRGVSIDKKSDNLSVNGRTTAYASSNEIADYIAKVKQNYLNAAKDIRNNQFMIHPFVDGSNSTCKNCSYRDICYVRPSQMHFIGQEEENNDE